ncbi:hypothetical protein B0T14DRAFT_210231 [Immersiella caudata]|uniref:Uncharacterized protein n=1 Tax=Immersiella caudata TaxID=314043 RepID=A0AA39WQ62_9PEZI|nr:hypothetical protein B0T14DRAFT_210231 [Immersiella caudata]
MESATFGSLAAPIKALTRKQTNKGWQFHKHWLSAEYHTGDLYQDARQEHFRKQWEVKSPGPYLRFVRDLSSEWPHLRGLSDFMEVGTDPMRWRDFFNKDSDNKYTYPEDEAERAQKQTKRVERTNVSQIVYFEDGRVTSETYTSPVELEAACLDVTQGEKEKHPKLRLFVVEDLSRTVIEHLGSAFDIDPDFFRAHVFDWVWFNIRDPLWVPPTLQVDAMRRDWYQLRFCRARYFPSLDQFKKGQEAVNHFNVGRKLYEDENKAYWDSDVQSKIPAKIKKGPVSWVKGIVLGSGEKSPKEKGRDEERPGPAPEKLVTPDPESLEDSRVDAKVGYMRTRATIWSRQQEESDCKIVVLLLDPTIEEGFPLWRGYRNWDPIPAMRDTTTANGRPQLATSGVPSLTRRGRRLQQDTAVPLAPSKFPSPPPSFFSDFLFWAKRPDAVLGETTPANASNVPTISLLRLVSAEWLTMSQYIKTRLSQIDWEITHPKEFLTQTQFDIILNKLHTWRRLVPQFRDMIAETQIRLFENAPHPSPLDPFRVEFRLILKQMEEYESRIDRLTMVVTSAISIADSRRVERLTILAMLFVPLSLVGTLFSMSDNVAEIGDTFGYWAVASTFCVAVLFGWTGWSRKQSSNLKAR